MAVAGLTKFWKHCHFRVLDLRHDLVTVRHKVLTFLLNKLKDSIGGRAVWNRKSCAHFLIGF